MSDQIAQRIGRELDVSNLCELLAEKLSGADLHSLLLAVFKRRIGEILPARLTQENAATLASNVSGRLLNKVDQVAFETASHFEAVELSPVTPLGAVAVLTGLDQGNVLSTIRALECASDPTIGLALECARLRRKQPDRKETHRLCTSQRVLRFPLPSTPGYTAHFKLLCMVSAGRDVGSFGFEVEALREQIDFYLTFVKNLRAIGFSYSHIAVQICDTRLVSHLCARFNIDRDNIKATVRARDSQSSERLLEKYAIDWPKAMQSRAEELAAYDLPEHLIRHMSLIQQDLCDVLQGIHEGVEFSFNLRRLTGLGYYDGPCFHIKMTTDRGESFMLADGGFVQWTQRLLGDKKERLLTSAIGIELLCRLFRVEGDTAR